MPAIKTSLAEGTGYTVSQGTFSASRSSPRETSNECSPFPLRICLRADLYPRVYFPDFTTSASLAEMDSEDFAAFDFFVGAITIVFFLRRVDCLRMSLDVFRAVPEFVPSNLYSSTKLSSISDTVWENTLHVILTRRAESGRSR